MRHDRRTAFGESEPTLEAVIATEGDTVGFSDFSNGTEKTFGVFICTNGGVVGIKGVSPAKAEVDITYLGALLCTSSEKHVGAAHGFPPEGVDENRLQAGENTTFEKNCWAPKAIASGCCPEPDESEPVRVPSTAWSWQPATSSISRSR